jgi:hypothetical protein
MRDEILPNARIVKLPKVLRCGLRAHSGRGEEILELSSVGLVRRNASAVSDAPHCKKAGRFGDVVRGASDTALASG